MENVDVRKFALMSLCDDAPMLYALFLSGSHFVRSQANTNKSVNNASLRHLR